MTEGDSTDLALLVAQEVAKQVPIKDIYQDGLAAGTKEAGGLISDIVKVARLALAPIQYGAVIQDRFRRFIENSAQRVEAENRVLPAPQILGPVLEAIKYEPEGSLTDEAFSKLLSRAFDKEKLDLAHPSFPGLIRTLADDEINILLKLEYGEMEIPCSLQKGSEWKYPNSDLYENIFPELCFPHRTLVYVEHLESLGLIQMLIASNADYSQTDNEGFFMLYWPLRLQNYGRMFIEAALKSKNA